MSSWLTGSECLVLGKITRSGLDTRSSRPPASTVVASALAMPRSSTATGGSLGVVRNFGWPRAGAATGIVGTMAASRKSSAGILLHRTRGGRLEVLLVHPGGPLWARRDAGVWSIPKGEGEAGEAPEAAARREFAGELGVSAPDSPAHDLGQIRQKSGKIVRAFALEGDL